ncbi:sensor histidine kinase [Actinoplanes derwentensis]|uniref:Sensor-like histidine kinase SenX3 n=1 Tax=Actinoplanes derwentensis TaxID=113562 RepID=A0A1H2ALF1_9ACTN|nr:HAMP domain-containing sensor histidine kinase [Actinoplanes derwentensis]GID88811.1 hypothetical protein Ade03nite_77350 [Actinoplanes derwentensis]SDT46763.1 His Kinase A (phospho-acceptor) domain-containing protein [Actinoplanes derwentensis]
MTRHQEGSALKQDVVTVGTELAALRIELERERQHNADLQRTVERLYQSVAELRTFARDVSHDLKAPLAGVYGYAQLLEHLDVGYPHPPGYDEYVSEINRSAGRMRQLIDDVLTYASTEDARLRTGPIDLGALVDDLATDALSLTTPVPRITRDALPVIRGDHGMVRRLMENLLGNAIKYVPLGEAAQVHVAARAVGDGTVRIEISDQGIGIQAGQHELIFEELHRSLPEAYPGNGLGLAICRRIVRRLGGVIAADPHYQDGARIWLTLPLEPAPEDGFAVAGPELDRTHTHV